MKIVNSFTCLKYLNPIWYFNLFPENAKSFSTCYFNSSLMSVQLSNSDIVTPDKRYSSKAATELDLGYQAWNKGVMLKIQETDFEKLIFRESPSTEDDYIFIRKYFNWKSTCYFFIIKIIYLHNPIKEIYALLKTRSIRRVSLINPHVEYKDYKLFSSDLVNLNPLVSVIIPTLNRYEYLKDVLSDLEKQKYKNIEIIIIDQTDIPDKLFYKHFSLNIVLIYQEGKGQWLARNEAIRNANGKYLLFFDDDSRVDEDWVSEHLKGLDFFKADISAGVSISKTGDKVPENYSYFRWADQFDSGNALVKREVFEKIGMFDRQFDKQRMGDGEFGLRAYLHGFKSISHPYAKRLHLKTGTGGLRQMGSWDAFRPKKFFSPRPLPSVLYYYRKYFPKEYVLNALLIGMFPSLIPYKWKGKKFLYPISALMAIFILPVLILQLNISWRISTQMLKEGDKVEWL